MAESRSESIPTADTEEEWRALLDSDSPGIVRSRDDWDRAMADEGRRTSILPGCDEEAVYAFTEGLRFRNGGLASADAAAVADKLTFSEYMDLWNTFGIGSRLATDYIGMKCDGAHTCVSSSLSYVCTSNC